MANGTIPSSLNCNDYLISGNTLSTVALWNELVQSRTIVVGREIGQGSPSHGQGEASQASVLAT
jgi:hypothetical protein